MSTTHYLVRELANPSQKFTDPDEMIAYWRRRRTVYIEDGKLPAVTVWKVMEYTDAEIEEIAEARALVAQLNQSGGGGGGIALSTDAVPDSPISNEASDVSTEPSTANRVV